ncbi:signal peptidase II [Fodinicola feengrottensis]|uniref:Lipoprotein signal peptidase n=1 Tax=Fodinicola feengrottensis TaxID=435914 RepID=A0ABN2HR77_9ACTN|nr:signal peptidase II [Fodinicola feengrottensis]
MSTTGDDEPAAVRPRPLLGRILPFAVIAVVVIGLDQLTKALVVAYLEGRPPIWLIGNLVSLQPTRNTGAAFSLGQTYTVVLSLFAIGVIGYIIRIARKLKSLGWAIALGLILGGAAGNLTDRIFRAPAPLQGGVVDFVSIGWWPIFNVADSCLCVGVGLVVLLVFRGIGVDGQRMGDQSAKSDGPVSDSSS